MRGSIISYNLPGRTFWRPDGSPMHNVHVGVQLRREPFELTLANANATRWHLDVDVVDRNGSIDFRGPAVQGKPVDRFIYLTWGNVGPDDTFEMFRRAKLMLNRIDSTQGKPVDRFIYLTWGNVGPDDTFEMFRRAKLMLNRIDSTVVRSAADIGVLVACVDLTGDDGGPRCARVDPLAIGWTAGAD